MKLTLEADWVAYEGHPLHSDHELEIAGCEADVSFRGDVWDWQVKVDRYILDSGWVDTPEGAKEAAESAIRKFFERESVHE